VTIPCLPQAGYHPCQLKYPVFSGCFCIGQIGVRTFLYGFWYNKIINLYIMQNITKRLIVWAVVVALILLVPLVAMQFTEEVDWDPFDFVLMGAVMFGIGLAYELIARRSEKTVYRVAFGVGLAGAFLLFWVNGAVGIIGNEGQPANLMYGAVFAVGLVGSIMARFKSRGMARTLFAAALVQFLVPIITLIVWPQVSWGGTGIVGVFVLNAFFAMLFVVSAMLFRRASISEPNRF